MAEIRRRRQPVDVEDGTRLELNVFEQAGRAAAPLLVCMPAMGVEARYYEPFARQLLRRGVHVVTCDLRGHGASSVRPRRGTDFGYHELVSRDWTAVVRAAGRVFPLSPLFLLGHSLGGQLSSLFLGRGGRDVRGLVLVASCSVYWRNYGRLAGLKVLLGTQAAASIAGAWGYFPGRTLGFAGTEFARLMRDWARQARTGRYTLAGALGDDEARLAGVRHPVLAVSVEGDLLAPAAAVEHLCRKMPRAQLTRWHYTRAEAGQARLDHFRWVRHGGPLAARICAWVRDVLRDGLDDRRRQEGG